MTDEPKPCTDCGTLCLVLAGSLEDAPMPYERTCDYADVTSSDGQSRPAVAVAWQVHTPDRCRSARQSRETTR